MANGPMVCGINPKVGKWAYMRVLGSSDGLYYGLHGVDK